MSFNGSGTFLINSTGQPVVANTVISATVFNALTADLASGLTNCITKDGQSTPTANIPMGSNKITGLANGTLINDAATLGQVQTTAAKLITSVSGVDTVTGIMSPTLTAYAAGQLFYFVAAGANTGAVTLNIDGLGAKAVTRDGASALAAGDINSGEMVVVIYDGTRFQMINAANSFGNTTINGTLTVTGNTALQANVSITSALSVHGTFNVSGAAALGSTLAVTGKSDLPTVSTASINAAVAVVTTGTVTNLTATSASVASVNAGVALLTTATVTDLTASSASIASANIGNLQFTAASIASINAGVAVVTNLTATSASIASANVGTAVVTTGTVTNLASTSASIASANAAVALVTTGTVTNLTSTAASIASANLGTAVVTTGTVTNLTATSASIASANAGTAVVTNLTATGASIASANVGTGVVTALTVTGASIASANVGTGVITTLTATGASVASINAGVALVTTGTVTNLTSTTASIASANIGVAAIGTLSFTGASIASLNAGTATITSGNLTFSSTGQRITGDMSNATIANRLAFQSSTTNGNTLIGAIPNGTSVTSGFWAFNNSDLTNAGRFRFSCNSTEAFISSDFNGTGTYLPMTFYTGGSERMRLDTSGNLGIGTSTANKSSSSTALTVNTGTAANYSAVEWASGDTLNYHINANNSAIYHVAAGTRPWIVYTNGSERMRLDASGNLGIGTASPVSKLSVGGNPPSSGVLAGVSAADSISLALSDNTNNSLYVKHVAGGAATFGTDSGGQLAFATNGFTERMRIDSSGNVGIGATTGAEIKVKVGGTLPSSGNSSYGVRVEGSVPSGSTSRADYFNTSAATDAASFTLSDLQHFNAAQGTFGAGSTVTNQYGFRVRSNLTGATNNYGFYSDIASGTNRWNFYAAGTAKNYFAGNTGIGVDPTVELDVRNGAGNCTISAQYGTGTKGQLIAASNEVQLKAFNGTNDVMTFVTGASERMRITSGGNVNIGTTTDVARLHVSRSDNDVSARVANSLSTGLTTDMFQVIALNHAAGTGFYFHRCYSSSATVQFAVRGDGTIYAQNTTVQSLSDARVKENVRTATEGLAVIDALRPVRFDFKNGFGNNRKNQLGFVAQEVEAVFPDAVDVMGDKDENGDSYKSVGPAALIPVLVKAIQELSAKVAALEAR